jgi:hypothetical protein
LLNAGKGSMVVTDDQGNRLGSLSLQRLMGAMVST